MRTRSTMWVAVIWTALHSASTATAEPADTLTDRELVAIRDGYSARRDAMLSQFAGKPFVPAAIRPPLKPGRGRYARHYGYSVTDFAMKAFLLDEQLDEANRALQEYGRFYINDPAARNDRDSFYWPADVVCRMVEFFGSRGSRVPGRLTQQSEDVLLEMAWVYSKETSKTADAETVVSKTWHVHESENHHLQRFSTVWHFSKLLKNDDRYKNRPYDDGKTALEHYHAWTQYALEFLRERARKGLFVEIASKGYGLQSIKCIYSFHDFSEDPSLKSTAGRFLDLFWATWAEEQIDGVRGGGKTRVYQGNNSQAQSHDSINRLAWYYLGQGDGSPPRGNEFSIITSDYRLPLVVMDIALDTAGRGNYEIIQRRMGLAWDGYYTPPNYRLRTDFGGILRYSYCTPDFIVGTLMCEARPLEDWTMISSQNRWHGVIFAGHPNARLYVQCRGDKKVRTLNQQWSVQRKGTHITQRLTGEKYSRDAEELRVWFAKSGLNNRRERGRWVFVEAPAAYAAVCPVAGGYHWVKANGLAKGDWLCCENSLTPVITEVASKTEFEDYQSFQDKILASELQFENQKLTYNGLGGDRFTFYADYSQVPDINDQAIDYAPENVFKSPFIQSVWNSGIVTIRKDQRKSTLDFNSPSLTIGLIGDSTVASTYGWGPAFAYRFNGQTKVLNYAKNGATLESLSKKLDELLKQKPDYVLIQFGHNDQKRYDTKVYGDKLRSYVERVTKAGGQAILVSSVTRRNFDEQGKIKLKSGNEPGKPFKANLAAYAQAAQAVAQELKVPFIDLHTISVEHHNKIGPEASVAYNFNESDTTHFSKKGAYAIANLVLKELQAIVPELTAYLK